MITMYRDLFGIQFGLLNNLIYLAMQMTTSASKLIQRLCDTQKDKKEITFVVSLEFQQKLWNPLQYTIKSLKEHAVGLKTF